MREVIETNAYKKHFKKSLKQNKDSNKLFEFLEPKYKDHQLKGELKAYRECHVEPDWLLVYKKQDNKLYLAGLGSHSEVFK